jgi:hypothetical protein
VDRRWGLPLGDEAEDSHRPGDLERPCRSIHERADEKPRAGRQALGLRNFIKEEIVKERRNTIFVSTHNLEEAEKLCERVAIVDDGRIEVAGGLKATLSDSSKISDVFLHYTGKEFEELAETAAPGFRRGSPCRGGLGRRRGEV